MGKYFDLTNRRGRSRSRRRNFRCLSQSGGYKTSSDTASEAPVRSASFLDEETPTEIVENTTQEKKRIFRNGKKGDQKEKGKRIGEQKGRNQSQKK